MHTAAWCPCRQQQHTGSIVLKCTTDSPIVKTLKKKHRYTQVLQQSILSITLQPLLQLVASPCRPWRSLRSVTGHRHTVPWQTAGLHLIAARTMYAVHIIGVWEEPSGDVAFKIMGSYEEAEEPIAHVCMSPHCPMHAAAVLMNGSVLLLLLNLHADEPDALQVPPTHVPVLCLYNRPTQHRPLRCKQPSPPQGPSSLNGPITQPSYGMQVLDAAGTVT